MLTKTFDNIEKMIVDLADMKVKLLEAEVESTTEYADDWLDFQLEVNSIDYIISLLRDQIEAYL